MRCLIPGRYIKLFAKAIHCLSKLGEELYVEALPDGLALRTVNLSRSAYACFKFHSSFFLSYDDGSKNFPEHSEIEEMLKCKIALKSCLSVFKSMNNIEKSVDRCRMDLNVCKGQLVFLLFCKHVPIHILKSVNTLKLKGQSWRKVWVFFEQAVGQAGEVALSLMRGHITRCQFSA